ncbi:MAG: hypothetical protein AB8F78_19670 [Saprospiraceae bacterium]
MRKPILILLSAVTVIVILSSFNQGYGTDNNPAGSKAGDNASHLTATSIDDTPPTTYTASTLQDLRSVDPNTGVPNRINERVEVEGIVFGFDTEFLVTNFNILNDDGTAGLAIINNSNLLDYPAGEGDIVRIRGTLRQVVGLTYLEAVELDILSVNASVSEPISVDVLDETLEGRFVIMDSLQMLSPAEWQNQPTATFDVRFTLPNGDTLIAQAAAGMSLFGSARPGEGLRPYSVQGVVRQNDTEAPFFSSYYLLPRFVGDFQEADVVSTVEIGEDELDVRLVDNQLEVNATQPISQISIFGMDGRLNQEVLVTAGSTFVKTQITDVPAAPVVVWVRLADGRTKATLISTAH